MAEARTESSLLSRALALRSAARESSGGGDADEYSFYSGYYSDASSVHSRKQPPASNSRPPGVRAAAPAACARACEGSAAGSRVGNLSTAAAPPTTNLPDAAPSPARSPARSESEYSYSTDASSIAAPSRAARNWQRSRAEEAAAAPPAPPAPTTNRTVPPLGLAGGAAAAALAAAPVASTTAAAACASAPAASATRSNVPPLSLGDRSGSSATVEVGRRAPPTANLSTANLANKAECLSGLPRDGGGGAAARGGAGADGAPYDDDYYYSDYGDEVGGGGASGGASAPTADGTHATRAPAAGAPPAAAGSGGARAAADDSYGYNYYSDEATTPRGASRTLPRAAPPPAPAAPTAPPGAPPDAYYDSYSDYGDEGAAARPKSARSGYTGYYLSGGGGCVGSRAATAPGAVAHSAQAALRACSLGVRASTAPAREDPLDGENI